MAKLQCIVVTPEKTILDQPADFVALPLFDGEIGLAPGRSPMIGRLGSGEMRLLHKDRDETVRYYVEGGFVEGGFVEVVDDVVSVLTNRAVRAEDLVEEAARDRLDAARERPARSPELMEIRDRLVSQARAELRVAKHRE
jgi:F-type H+-transporting ATPase subunit epsilon